MKKSDVKKTLIFASAVFVMTLSGAVMPLSEGTYIHVGDAAVYAAALMLPTPLACIAAAIGAGLGDAVLGSFTYIIPTLVIKPLTVIVCRALSRLSKDKSVSDLIACGAGIVTIAGYLVAEMVIGLIAGKENAVKESFDSVIFNSVQALASAVVFFIVIGIARRICVSIQKKAEKKQEEQNESADVQ